MKPTNRNIILILCLEEMAFDLTTVGRNTSRLKFDFKRNGLRASV